MPADSTNQQPPFLGLSRPDYPPLLQLVRVTGGTVPGPSGYGSSSFLGPVLDVAAVQQLRTDTVLPRDREPCLVLDVNGYGLAAGYYLGRLAGSYTSLPVYEVGGGGGAQALTLPGLTPAQLNSLVQTLSPAQIAVLGNLSSCQLQTFLTLTVPQQQILTGSLTATQLGALVDGLTSTQLQTLLTTLNVVQLQAYTTALTTGLIQQPPTYPAAQTISGTTNNFAPTTWAPVIPLNVSTTSTLTGLVPPVTLGSAYALPVTLLNVGVGTLTLASASASSTAANRFTLDSATSVSVPPGGSVGLVYDVGNATWRTTGASPGTASGTGGTGATNTLVSYGPTATTVAFATVFDASDTNGLHGCFTIKNSGGVNTLSYKVTATDAFGNTGNTTGSLLAGAYTAINVDSVISGITGVYLPATEIKLELQDGSGSTTYTVKRSFIGNVTG